MTTLSSSFTTDTEPDTLHSARTWADEAGPGAGAVAEPAGGAVSAAGAAAARRRRRLGARASGPAAHDLAHLGVGADARPRSLAPR